MPYVHLLQSCLRLCYGHKTSSIILLQAQKTARHVNKETAKALCPEDVMVLETLQGVRFHLRAMKVRTLRVQV